MKVRGIGRLLVAALALVALFSTPAAAQFTPTLTATATGNRVIIDWTPIAGAQGHQLVAGTSPGSANLATVNIPAQFGTHVEVSAPNGTYYLRVRAYLGNITGPFSDEVSVSPGLEACVPGSAAALAATPDSVGGVTVNWTPVPGATAYHVQWSRFSGGTELVEVVSGTSTKRTIGMNGTFFVRVVAITACGNVTSNEAPFTIAFTKRHLSAGEITAIMQEVRAQYPGAWFNSHRDGSPERWDYIILAGRRLYAASGGTVGCNYRRATVGDLSMDGLSIENPSNGRYYFIDAVSGAGGPNPQIFIAINFSDSLLLRNDSGQYAPWGFANPFNHKTYVNYGAAGGW